MKKTTLSLILLAQTVAVAHAQDLSYTYVEGSVLSVDYDGEKGTGLSIAGSKALNDHISVIGSYSFVRSDDEYTTGGVTDEIDVKTSTLGFSLNVPSPILKSADLVFSAQYMDEATETGSASEGVDGESYSLLMRAPVTSSIEVFGGMLHVRGAGDGETGYRGGIRAGLFGALTGGISYSTIDDVDTAGLFLRYNM